MSIKLSDNFTYKKLLRFTLPSIAMMIFTSVYYVVDGFFVSNYAGKTPFAAVNIIMPFLMILGVVGFMFGTGGSALVAKTLGEGDKTLANRRFSLFVYVPIAVSVLIACAGIVFLRDVALLLGAEGELADDAVRYGRIILCALPMFVAQIEFQSFFVTAEKPQLGLAVTLFAGGTNMVLDWLLVAVFGLGLRGAALATAFSQTVGGVAPLIYFARKNSGLLRLGKTSMEWKALSKACTNGLSELMTNISMSVVGILYNWQLLEFAGEDGVAAYGVMMYVGMIFSAVFIGYSIGSAPVFGFHYGAENKKELKSLFSKSIYIIGAFSVCMVVAAECLAYPLSKLFVGYDTDLFRLTCDGFRIYSLSFLFMGAAIFGSGYFTALNDGLTSAAISFLRTAVFQIAAVMLLPKLLGVDGIWWSLVISELLAAALFFVFWYRLQYRTSKT